MNQDMNADIGNIVKISESCYKYVKKNAKDEMDIQLDIVSTFKLHFCERENE